jgi:hypothetical protein
MMKKESDEKFDSQFKKIILGIIDEEGYFKDKNIKILIQEIIKELDPIIALHVKNHFLEIGQFLVNSVEEKPEKIGEEKNAKTS